MFPCTHGFKELYVYSDCKILVIDMKSYQTFYLLACNLEIADKYVMRQTFLSAAALDPGQIRISLKQPDGQNVYSGLRPSRQIIWWHLEM